MTFINVSSLNCYYCLDKRFNFYSVRLLIKRNTCINWSKYVDLLVIHKRINCYQLCKNGYYYQSRHLEKGKGSAFSWHRKRNKHRISRRYRQTQTCDVSPSSLPTPNFLVSPLTNLVVLDHVFWDVFES